MFSSPYTPRRWNL